MTSNAIPIIEELKVCKTCKQPKPLSEYGNGRFRSGRMQLQYDCKPCHSENNRQYRERKLPPPIRIESLPGEQWKRIYWFKGREYHASNYGRVKSAISRYNRDEKFKTQFQQSGDPYPLVRLSYNHKETVFAIHRIVARLFVRNPYMKPYVNHKDGDKNNFYYENLEWCTLSENTQHYFRELNPKIPKGEEKWNALLNNIEALYIFKSTKKVKELAELFSVRENIIRDIKRGYTWKSVTGKQRIYKTEEDETRYRREILEIFHSKERVIDLCKKYNKSYTNIKYIKNGRIHSEITGKVWIRKCLTINQYV